MPIEEIPGTVSAIPFSSIAGIRSQVQTVIDGSGPMVLEQVIQIFSKAETDRRVALLVDGLKRHAAAEAEYDKIRPDHKILADDGAIAFHGWTLDQKKKKDSAKRLVDRLTNALTEAMSNRNFKPLEEAVKGGGQKDGDT